MTRPVIITILALSALTPCVAAGLQERERSAAAGLKCLVCGRPARAAYSAGWKRGQVYHDSSDCRALFRADPKKYSVRANAQLVASGQARQVACPVTGEEPDPRRSLKIAGRVIAFCCASCQGRVAKASEEAKLFLVFSNTAFGRGFEVAGPKASRPEARRDDGSGAGEKQSSPAPCPPSAVIRGIRWASRESIVRRARGSDNWPLAWADDGELYTAYGDGRGFEPQVEKKLSMGFAKISGSPEDFRGVNIRSQSGETLGDGARGRKASGLLVVDGVIYLWARNAGNSQLAWSRDHARTWTWSDWKFTTSFGYPTFLDFGRDYSGARDGYVYIYSHDADSAYEAADRMVLARVARDRIREREAYEFFVELAPDGAPHWSRRIDDRGAVFEHRGRCYRSGVSYNAGLRRYLWCQVHPGSEGSRGPRFQGGFGVYDAPEPWGPWTTVSFTENWDVGPGETSSFPPKWMSADGKTLHLVFSGDDCFSVRRATLEVAPSAAPEEGQEGSDRE